MIEDWWFDKLNTLSVESAIMLWNDIKTHIEYPIDSNYEVKITQRHHGILIFPFESVSKSHWRSPKIMVCMGKFWKEDEKEYIIVPQVQLMNFDTLGIMACGITDKLTMEQRKLIVDALEIAIIWAKGLEKCEWQKLYNKDFDLI